MPPPSNPAAMAGGGGALSGRSTGFLRTRTGVPLATFRVFTTPGHHENDTDGGWGSASLPAPLAGTVGGRFLWRVVAGTAAL